MMNLSWNKINMYDQKAALKAAFLLINYFQ